MVLRDFSHVDTWVFDLDNTLYPPSMQLFDQIKAKISNWVMTRLNLPRDRADILRQHYLETYGTTLAGLMHEHGVEPWDYLSDVHDIDFSPLRPDPLLAKRLAALPGRRIVFTNADAHYAQKVLQARGLSGLFDAVYGVEHAGFCPKPESQAFKTVFAQDGLEPTNAAMFEDDPRNLLVPHAMGLRTVLVAPESIGAAHIHHTTTDLTQFLGLLTKV